MAASGAREQPQRSDPAKRFADVASACERIAARISERKPEAHILDALRQAESLCRAAASEAGLDQESTTLLSNLSTAMDTWHTVWPRLSQHVETGPSFCAAVVRECGLWSRRLHALAKTT